MEQKLNIAEILKDKPKGTKLYSLVYGDVKLELITEEDSKYPVITRVDAVCGIEYISFTENGLHYEGYPGAELVLFPSSKMRDWSKFAWKKGDVLTNSSGFKVFFDKWVNEDYTKFLGKIKILGDSHYYYYDTAYYILASKKEALEFIKSVEEINNGKPNLKTLEIEKGQPEFKDGDIVVAEEDNYYDKVIFIATIKDDIVSKALINVRYEDYEVYYNKYRFGHNRSLRLATDSEKQQLFDALAKEGKRWDAEKKQIVDLKPKYEFKPMDLCLMKYIGQYNNRGWELCQYAYTEHRVSSSGEQRDFYHAVGGEIYAECIPYKGNEHLLGTKKSK